MRGQTADNANPNKKAQYQRKRAPPDQNTSAKKQIVGNDEQEEDFEDMFLN